MKNIKYIIIGLVTTLCTSSCSDWLDVQPSDQVSENVAFGSLSGFKQTLNGVYVELNASDLYGKALSCELIELLAQQYAVSSEATAYKALLDYDYTGATVKDRFSKIWSKSYNLIANVNKILENCEKRRGTVLSEEYYHLFKGEALALRALLHFDIFRIFGPVYSSGNETQALPYYETFSLNQAQAVSASEYMEKVIRDLNSALDELKNDPVIENGVKGDLSDTFLKDRNLRLNYYAVKALLARAYMYIGEKELAVEQADDIIEMHNQAGYFPFVNSNDALAKEPDRVFSSEILFGLQNLNVKSLYSSMFDANTLKPEALLAPKADMISQLYSGSDVDDLRYRTSLNKTAEVGGNNYAIFQKYMGGDSIYSQIIPMIRISEMYYIKAEAEIDNDPEQAYQILKDFLIYRGIANPKIRTPRELLDSEYKKEFFGEGQLFFYYKRLNRSSIPSAYGTSEVNMSSNQYVVPVPDGENQYN